MITALARSKVEEDRSTARKFWSGPRAVCMAFSMTVRTAKYTPLLLPSKDAILHQGSIVSILCPRAHATTLCLPPLVVSGPRLVRRIHCCASPAPLAGRRSIVPSVWQSVSSNPRTICFLGVGAMGRLHPLLVHLHRFHLDVGRGSCHTRIGRMASAVTGRLCGLARSSLCRCRARFPRCPLGRIIVPVCDRYAGRCWTLSHHYSTLP